MPCGIFRGYPIELYSMSLLALLMLISSGCGFHFYSLQLDDEYILDIGIEPCIIILDIV